MSSMYDVAIIGGGPAGSTAAALLARAGRRVIVFECERFPRFHIGESLLPFSMKAFTRLGLHEKFLPAGWAFYFLVWLQRHHPIVPRLTLVPKRDEAVPPAQTAGVVS